MKNIILGKDSPIKPVPNPFMVKQALAAIEFGKTDESILEYFYFFSSIVPVENKYFVHVIPNMSFFDSLFVKTEATSFDSHELKTHLVDKLQDKIDTYFSSDEKPQRAIILEGNPLEEVLKVSKEIEADLLLIGQDSNKKHHDILAKNLVRKSKGNALIIPSAALTSITRILVPIDFSAHSRQALQTAIGINKQLDHPAEIIALHVYELPNLSHYKTGHSLSSFEDSIKSNIAEAMEKFLKSAAPEDRSSIKTQLILKDLPGTAKYIIDTAKKDKVDFVVMGIKGHSKIETLLLGSVAERFITLNKTIPTMIVG